MNLLALYIIPIRFFLSFIDWLILWMGKVMGKVMRDQMDVKARFTRIAPAALIGLLSTYSTSNSESGTSLARQYALAERGGC